MVDFILIDEKSYGKFLVFYILYKTLLNLAKRINFYKTDRFIKVYDGTSII